MRYYFNEMHEDLFMLHTYKSIDGYIRGRQIINLSKDFTSARIQNNLSYNRINPYYHDYAVIRFCENLENFLISENIYLYVERKNNLCSVDDWIRECKPYVDLTKSQMVKFKLVVT